MSIWKLRTNPDKEKDGVWFDLATPDGGLARFKVARHGGSNAEFTKMFEKESRPYRRLLKDGQDVDSETMYEIMLRVYASTVVRAWENVTNEDGTELECTPDNVYLVLSQIDYVFDRVREEAQKNANYQAEDIRDDAKNS